MYSRCSVNSTALSLGTAFVLEFYGNANSERHLNLFKKGLRLLYGQR